jgi:RNA polymerase sigma factor (TIGR02999 family)
MPADINALLAQWRSGNAEAGEAVVAETYDELRRVARGYLRRERPGHLLQTTALLHEAYVRLLRTGPGPADTREAFFRLMASEMRRRLVDHARRRMADKRGGGAIHETFDSSTAPAVTPHPAGDHDAEAVLDRLDQALGELSGAYPRAAQVVQLRYLAGLTTEETAAALDLSPGTVKRDWTFAKAWLAVALEADPPVSLVTDPP